MIYGKVSGVASELVKQADARADARRQEGQNTPDYASLAEAFRCHTALDSAVPFAQELARLRHPSGALPPNAPTFRGRFGALIGRVFSPLLWRLIRASSTHDPFEAVYRILIEQQERQVQAEARIDGEIAALCARLDQIETALQSRRPAD